ENIFTSGGTEADNLALNGVTQANKEKGKHIITTVQEHHSTLNTTIYLETNGFTVTYLSVYEDGKVAVEDLKNALTEETILVTFIRMLFRLLAYWISMSNHSGLTY